MFLKPKQDKEVDGGGGPHILFLSPFCTFWRLSGRHRKHTDTHLNYCAISAALPVSDTGSNHLGLISDFTNTHSHTHTRAHAQYILYAPSSLSFCVKHTRSHHKGNKHACQHMFHIFTHLFTLVYSCSTSTHTHTRNLPSDTGYEKLPEQHAANKHPSFSAVITSPFISHLAHAPHTSTCHGVTAPPQHKAIPVRTNGKCDLVCSL